jgi:GNAT superfamily N-acetyltransferase
MSQDIYEAVVVPVPIAESHVTKYKEIRLQSLLLDPAAFGSTYAREITYTQDKWRQRLDSPHVATIVVYSNQTSASNRDDALNQGKWVGIMTILAPAALGDRARVVGVGEETQVYQLFGVWVHPEHRGKGLGIRLVETGLEWVRRNNDPQNVTGTADKVVALQAIESNESAGALYRKAGFKKLPREYAPPGEEPFMIVQV